MRGIVLVICCYFCGDEHNQVVCPPLACALPMNSLADLNRTYVVYGDIQHKGLGEPVLTTATVDGSGLSASFRGEEKTGLTITRLQWCISTEILYSP